MNKRQWFSINYDDGTLYPLGECSDYEEADNAAFDLGISAHWLLDEETARRWLNTLREAVDNG